ncbi:MAG TPA: hypothetical protein VGD76_17265, partial [Ramlibacter sp.]
MNSAAPSRFLRVAASALALCAAAAAVPAQTRAALDREQLERKLGSTSTLIESSSGARQIEASGAGEALARRARARELHGKASEALRAGDLDTASKLLDEASRAMFEGVRLAAPQQVADAKERSDYGARLESTRALVEAQKRIAAEKGGPRAAEPARQAEALIAEGEKLAAAGRLPDARAKVDQAYLTVKAAIGTAREGDTLVRSLNFASKREEYDYEIDRNDTHAMLIKVLLADRKDAAPAMAPFTEK